MDELREEERKVIERLATSTAHLPQVNRWLANLLCATAVALGCSLDAAVAAVVVVVRSLSTHSSSSGGGAHASCWQTHAHALAGDRGHAQSIYGLAAAATAAAAAQADAVARRSKACVLCVCVRARTAGCNSLEIGRAKPWKERGRRLEQAQSANLPTPPPRQSQPVSRQAPVGAGSRVPWSRRASWSRYN